ncbi:MAG TPA: hypothetical protein VGQ42_09165 [Candidatus Dormibacteraeota bacterium]|jgi:predicted Zn-dependent peptidase|nr:hypothetical protein [Candidatus Dormibacteraeota bacterium]
MTGDDAVLPGVVKTFPSDHAAVRAWAELDSKVTATACDGVPVFWAEMPAPRRAQLMFRAGRADEPFCRAGLSHLVEHLSLSTLGDRPYQYNGSVTTDLTSFTVAGNDGDIVEFLALVCAALRALPFDRLEAERRVLSTEAARRTPDPVAALLWARYGSTGLGLLGAEEHALRSAGPEDIQAWSDSRFTASNAVLLLTGPPPAGLHLDLPVGTRFGDAVSIPVAQPLPTWFKRNSAVVALGAIRPRGRGHSALERHLQRHMSRRLRHDLGISYSVQVADLRVDSTTTHLVVVADALPEQATAVTAAMVEELDRIAEHGVDQGELDRDLEQCLRAAQVAEVVGAVVNDRGTTLLLGEAPVSFAEGVERLLTLTGADLAAIAAEVRDSAMWLVPTGATIAGERFHPYVEFTPPLPEKSIGYFKPVTAGGGEKAAIGLAVGEQGVSMVLSNAKCVTVRWAECVGMQWWTTMQRVLYSQDGFRLAIDPAYWDRPDELLAMIDSRVPDHLRIPMGVLERTGPPPPKRKRLPWFLGSGLLRVAVFSAVAAIGGWSNAFSQHTSAPTPAPVLSTGPSFHYDPATGEISGLPSTIPTPQPTPSTGVDGAALAVGIAGTAAAAGVAGVVLVRRRRA